MRIGAGCSILPACRQAGSCSYLADKIGMCLAIPGRIISIDNQLALVDFNGIKKDINVGIVDVEIGDYVMVHAGFAIEKMEASHVADIQDYLKKDRNEQKS